MIADPERLPDWELELQGGIVARGEAWEVRCYGSVVSTMDIARSALRKIAETRPGVFIARSQTSGRGRQGRSWLQSKGALYATFAFCSRAGVASFSGFSLVAGCVVRDVVSVFGADVLLKWPNDVYSRDGRKLCGILVETAKGQGGNYLMIGIGINLREIPESFPGAVSLRELSGKIVSPVCLAGMLAPALWAAWKQFLKTGFGPYREKWIAAAMPVGEDVVVECQDGRLEGRFAGLDERGAMLLETGGGIRTVMSGHIGTVV